MKKDIFRKESMEKMESPDDLDRYVKVTTPKTWILLIAIVVLLIGGCVWGFLGQLNTVVKGACVSESGKQHCIINESDANDLNVGDTIKVAGTTAEITDMNILPSKYSEIASMYNFEISPGTEDDDVREFYAEASIPDGFYFIEVITETKAPFSFVFNY